MTLKHIVRVAALALPLAACSDMSATQQRALTGTTGGAAGGALIGAIAGNAGMGAAIGAGAGLAGGLLYDYHKKTEASAYERGVQQGSQSQKSRSSSGY
ncbi:glycine zipper family protein [Azospirillum soli]|uniref:glycine zipper family protein n=1 Tax=Azospirillum soli TaxID=1304799 RepID=UPI001AE54D56|nr:glycine zipper family protein [Azospirillum soli]MBP2311276.1 putative membrane protein [Azospirillum soli]